MFNSESNTKPHGHVVSLPSCQLATLYFNHQLSAHHLYIYLQTSSSWEPRKMPQNIRSWAEHISHRFLLQVSLCFLSVASEISDQDLDLQSWCSLWLFLVLSPSCWIKSLALLCPKKSLAFPLRLCKISAITDTSVFVQNRGGGRHTMYFKLGVGHTKRPTQVLGWGIWIIQHQFPQQTEINHMGSESIMTT